MSKSIADYNYHMREWIEQEFLIPFLAIDGDYNLFWTLTPRTLRLFWDAHEIKEKREHNLRDSENFQLGLYFKYAHASNLESSVKYPAKPIFQIEDKKEEKYISEQYKENEKLKLLTFLSTIHPAKTY